MRLPISGCRRPTSRLKPSGKNSATARSTASMWTTTLPARCRWRSEQGFAAPLAQTRKGDTLYVSTVDRLGRDAIDVQATVRKLMLARVNIDIKGLGLIRREVGEMIIAVLAQVADMRASPDLARANAGRAAARASLELTGRTHRGKLSLGRQFAADPRPSPRGG